MAQVEVSQLTGSPADGTHSVQDVVARIEERFLSAAF
jgi:hypothetical protein